MTTLKTRSLPKKSSSPAKTPLVGAATTAERELSVLRRGRERLAERPRPDETSARTAIAARRTRKI